MRTISEQKAGRTGVALGLSSRIMGLTRVLGGILSFALLHNPVQVLSAIVPPGQSVTLAWSPVTNANVAGHSVYYGSASGNYTNLTSVGHVTNATISGLTEGVTYYFAATTLSTSGLESDYSAEVSYMVPNPALSQVKLLVTPGKQFILTITGQAGQTYNIQASQDLITWTVIGTVTMGASGSLNFTDTNAASFSRRFYRIQG
jgi:hypothetical protein